MLQAEALSLLRCKPEKYFGFVNDGKIAISLIKGKSEHFQHGMCHNHII